MPSRRRAIRPACSAALLEQPQLPKPRLPEVADLPVLERLQQEFDALGFYLTRPSAGRLLAEPRQARRRAVGPAAARVPDSGSGSPAWCSASRSAATARSRFAFVQLSDPTGAFEVTLFAEQLGRAREHLETSQPVLVEGEVRLDGDVIKVLASSVAPLDVALANGSGHAESRIEVRLADSTVAAGPGGPARARTATAACACAWWCRWTAGRGRDRSRRRPSPGADAAARSRAPLRRARRGRPLARTPGPAGLEACQSRAACG